VDNSLKEMGLQFSDTPTHEEIQAAQKDNDLKRDMEGVDHGNIVHGKRKNSTSTSAGGDGAAGGNTNTGESAASTSSGPSHKASAVASSSDKPTKRSIQYNSSDEEADF
jgi:hypothetical protein